MEEETTVDNPGSTCAAKEGDRPDSSVRVGGISLVGSESNTGGNTESSATGATLDAGPRLESDHAPVVASNQKGNYACVYLFEMRKATILGLSTAEEHGRVSAALEVRPQGSKEALVGSVTPEFTTS